MVGLHAGKQTGVRMFGKGLLDAWLASRYKVVHQLPGRVRLSAPVLERLPSDWNHLVSDVVDVVKFGKGIEDVQITLASGRALVLYDPEQTDLKRIESWIKRLARMAHAEFEGKKPESLEHVQEIIERIRQNLGADAGQDRALGDAR